MALNQSASVQRNLLGRLGDPAAAGFKVRNATDMALMLADESYIVATLNIVQELQQEFNAAFCNNMSDPCDPLTSWKDWLDYCAYYDQFRHTLDLAVLKLKDALRAFDEYDYGEEDEEPPYHGEN